MGHKKNGPAAGDGKALRDSRFHTSPPTNNQTPRPQQEPITGSTVCTAAGITVNLSSPVLALCRALVAAGYDPATPLHAYRGDVLCLTVRSIGEGAKLKVNGPGTGFIRAPERSPAAPVRLNGGGGDR